MNIVLTDPMLMAGKPAKSINVAQLPFVKLAELASRASALSNSEYPFTAALRTLRMIEQCKAVLADGSQVDFDSITIRQITIPVGRKIHRALEDATIPGGKIIGDGDGASTPIMVELGTPIATGSDEKSFTELEFLARTYGDLEIVMGELNDLDKTVALIKHVAKPVGMQKLPSWAVEQITIPDGMFLMDNVLKRFLPSGDE